MEHEIPFTTFQPGIATSQPHEFLRNGATILGRKAAKRVTKSREVDFSPLRGFPPNMGSGMTGLLGFFKSHLWILHLISGSYWLIYWFHSDKNNWTGVCFSDIERANFSTLCLSCHRQRFQKQTASARFRSLYRWAKESQQQRSPVCCAWCSPFRPKVCSRCYHVEMQQHKWISGILGGSKCTSFSSLRSRRQKG